MDKREKTPKKIIKESVREINQREGKKFCERYRVCIDDMESLDLEILGIADYIADLYEKGYTKIDLEQAGGKSSKRSDIVAAAAANVIRRKEGLMQWYESQMEELIQLKSDLEGIMRAVELDPYEKHIFKHKYGDGIGGRPSNVQLGKKYRVTETTIRRWEKAMFEKIGKIFNCVENVEQSMVQ